MYKKSVEMGERRVKKKDNFVDGGPKRAFISYGFLKKM